jgi:hypothetical protein
MTADRTYYVTFVNARDQESNPSPASNTVDPNSHKINLTAIPLGATGVTKRRIYALATIGSTTDTWYVGEIENNTTTTFTDDVVDTDLIIGDVLETDNDEPAKASYILEHKNRLFTANGSLLYFSKLDKPEAFPTDNYILCNDTGDNITGLQLLNDWIVIIKERSVLMVNCDGEPTAWTLKVINDQRGCPYPETIQLIDNHIVFLGYDDLYEIAPTSVKDERSVLPTGKRIKPLLVGDTAPTSVDYDGRYWLRMGTTIIVYNYRRDSFTKYVFPDVPIAFHATPDYKLYFSTINGIMEYGVGTSFNGTLIQSFAVGRDIDMGRRSQQKKIKKVYAYYRKESSGKTMYIMFGTDQLGYTQPIELASNDDGYMEWGTGLWGQLWGGSDSPGKASYSISQKDNYFRVKVGSNTNPFEFYGYGIVYKLKPIK